MDAITIYPDGRSTITINCCNGFVARVVASVAYESESDALALAEHLNHFFLQGGRLETNGNTARLVPGVVQQ